MSATNRPNRPGEPDYYVTPRRAVQEVYDAIYWGSQKWILDAGCGNGAIGNFFVEKGHRVVGVDTDPKPGCNFPAFECKFNEFNPVVQFDAVVMNPPFNQAMEFVEKGLKVAPHVIALMRLAVLETKKRRPFFDKGYLAYVLVASNRYSFKNKGSDNTAYGWFVFERYPVSNFIGSWLPQHTKIDLFDEDEIL